MKIFILLLLSISAFAEVSKEVLIQGKIGGYFTDKEVKIIDKFGQTMIVPRSAFPKDFRIEQGKEFSFELNPSEIKQFKAAKK